MPSPFSADVTASSGKAAARRETMAPIVAQALLELFGLELVRLGEHDLMADRGFTERIERGLVGVFQAMPGVDQQVDAGEIGAAFQVGVDELRPFHDFLLRRFGVTVARHIDEAQRAVIAEIDQFLGAAGRVRCAREAFAAGQRVDQARLADIGASGKGDLDAAHLRQRLERVRRPQEPPFVREQLPSGVDFRGRECGRHECSLRRQDDGESFFLANVPLMLSNNSILAPFFFMMIDCWVTDSKLFHAQ